MWRSAHDAWWRLVAAPAESRSPAWRLADACLRVGAALYGSVVASRNRLYDRGPSRRRLPCPVISVGNLEVGGTGKTTCVEYLAAHLASQGRRVAVLSRGYGATRAGRPSWLSVQGDELLIDGEPGGPARLPDEPQLLARHLPGVPVVIGPRRAASGELALERFHSDVLLLDDGFQHRRLHRDLDIVLISARMPLGGWPLLPRGPMREPLSSVARADVIIVTKVDRSREVAAALQERLRTLNARALIATAMHEPHALRQEPSGAALSLERLQNARVCLLSSVGDPGGFEQTVTELGATVAAHAAFPDHHRYDVHEWRQVCACAAEAKAAAIVTTEKDAVRVAPLLAEPAGVAVPLWVVRVRWRMLSGEEALHDRLHRVCAG